MFYFIEISLVGWPTISSNSYNNLSHYSEGYSLSCSMASWYSAAIISACLADLGLIEHWNGSGSELKPSEKAKLPYAKRVS